METLVLPKVHSATDLQEIAKRVPSGRKLNLIASIESARSLWSIVDIATWRSGDIQVVALLVRLVCAYDHVYYPYYQPPSVCGRGLYAPLPH